MVSQTENTLAPPSATPAGHASAGPFGKDGIVAARLAISSLLPFYPKTISTDGKFQPESLFCITGALAGFAAQYAVRQELADAGGIDADAALLIRAPGAPIDPAAHPEGRVAIVQTPNGERYYFSDRINQLLLPDRLESLSAFSVIGGQAMRLGAAKSELPDCFTILERIVDTMGTSEFGAIRAPAGHVPAMPSRRAVEIFWPATLTAFSREPQSPVPGFKLLAPRLWPVALAMIAATYMEMAKGALAPALALTIFMEAALPMSKIDQAAVHFVRDTMH